MSLSRVRPSSSFRVSPLTLHRLCIIPLRDINGQIAVRRASSLPVTPVSKSNENGSKHPLAALPLSHVLRSYAVMALSSSPTLLNACMGGLHKMIQSKSILFDIDRNPILRWVLRRSFYDQFCAGENKSEVRKTVETLHNIGFNGIILEYSLEVLEDGAGVEDEATIQSNIDKWRDGLIQSMDLISPGDFVGLKWSGMGPEALRLLKANSAPSKAMADAMSAVCDAAVERGVLLLPAAEPQNANAAVDRWTLDLAEKYNKLEPGTAYVFNTYQCYLKSTPSNLAKHLLDATVKGYTMGVKLVRGAYLESETRNLIWDSKEKTDSCYDGITEALLHKKWNEYLQPPDGKTRGFPELNLVLATHNRESVQKAKTVCKEQSEANQETPKLFYAQLQGMADEVSCELIQAQSRDAKPQVFKCASWGSTRDCLNYLLRRAAENSDAFSRTKETRNAMGLELWRRAKKVFRLG